MSLGDNHKRSNDKRIGIATMQKFAELQHFEMG